MEIIGNEYDKCYFCKSYDEYEGCEYGCENKTGFEPDHDRIIAKAKAEVELDQLLINLVLMKQIQDVIIIDVYSGIKIQIRLIMKELILLSIAIVTLNMY